MTNLPNALTTLRLILTPVFVLLLQRESMWLAAAAFLIASVTDFVDGYLARRFSLVSDFGKIADPIADKLLTGSALIALSAMNQIQWWITATILVREVGVTAYRIAVAKRRVIPANTGGKIKTVLQIAAIEAYLIPGFNSEIARAFLWTALAVTVATGIDFVVRTVRANVGLPTSMPESHRGN